jgi:hypothetical protein
MFDAGGHSFRVTKLLAVIRRNGITCAGCNASALFFTTVDQKHLANNMDVGLALVFEHTDHDSSYVVMTKDHIIPRAIGGPNSMVNLQPMCSKCNTDKGHGFDITNVPDAVAHLLDDDGNVKPQVTSTSSHPSALQIIFYKGYIRWYTQACHPNTTLHGWNTTVKLNITKRLKATTTDFSSVLFELAFKQLRYQIVNQTKKLDNQKHTT